MVDVGDIGHKVQRDIGYRGDNIEIRYGGYKGGYRGQRLQSVRTVQGAMWTQGTGGWYVGYREQCGDKV